MGRIKPLMVKRTTQELMKKDMPFNGEFNVNKKILGNSMPSKKVRNKIAGYIARLHRAKQRDLIEPRVRQVLKEE
jgi:ribosomal protein S17E